MSASGDVMGRDEDTGRYSEEYTDDDILDVIRSTELADTSDVAEALGCNQRTARRRLNELADAGKLRKVSKANTNIWLLPDE